MAEQLPAAGWYPAPHANGELQYWDGASWMLPSNPSADTPAAKVGFFKKKTTRLTASILAASLFVVGILLGSGAGGAPRVDASELSSLRASASASPTPDAAALAQQEQLEEDHDEALALVDDLEAQLVDAQAQLATAQADLTARQGELGAAQARIVELEAASAPKPAPQQPAPQQPAPQQPAPQQPAPQQPAPQQPAPQQPSGPFKNCDAARAAGAAPVHRGDPGYGSHLDRDNDGVGCE